MDNLETKLVSAKDLIDYCKHYIELYKGTQTDKARRDELYAVIGQIVNMPSEQSDREKGKWLIADDIPSICSNCRANWIDDYVDSSELYFTGKIPNYCPNCGSDNRGEQDEE